MRRKGEFDAAAAPAQIGQPSAAAEKVHHLDQVVLGDVVRRGDLGDGRAPVGVGGEVHQHAQAVVGEARKAHGRILAGRLNRCK